MSLVYEIILMSVLFLVGYAQFGHKTEMRLKNS